MAEEDDAASSCRSRLARLFNVPESNNIAFTSGATESLNLAILGIGLKAGDHVVSTKIEHNSTIRPLKHLERDESLFVDFVECDRYANVAPENIAAAIKSNTKAIVVNHCSNVNGTILDLKSIAKIAHDNGLIFIVDASQSVGAIPIDFLGWDLDILAFTGHKSLFGLQGIGGVALKSGVVPKPLKVGGTGIKSEYLYQPESIPMFYEAGTPNMPGIVSLNAGAGFVLSEGIEKIHSRKTAMVKHVIAELGDMPEITIYNSPENCSYSNFTFNVGKLAPEEVGYALESSYDMTVRTGLHCAPLLLQSIGAYPWGTVRMSPSYFTSDSEIELFIDAIKEITRLFVRKNKI